jgi:cytoskeletal protein CcmA (bactofilin family)
MMSKLRLYAPVFDLKKCSLRAFALVVCLCAFTLLGALPAHAANGDGRLSANAGPHRGWEGGWGRSIYMAEPNFRPNEQVFNDDLVVEAGQTLEGDVVVYSGNVTVEEEGTIRGNLIVYSGNIEIERGGTITGDVTAFSGNIEVDGRVDGNLASASGNIDLAEAASIGGDVSVLAGEIEREAGAMVAGSVVRGPSFNFRMPHGMFRFPHRWGAPPDVAPPPDAPVELGQRGLSWGERLGWFILSLVGAGVVTAVVALFAGVLTVVWPQYVAKTENAIRAQVPLNFAVGLLANLSMLFLSVLFLVLLCTAPLHWPCGWA